MPESFDIFRFEVAGPDGQSESRWSLTPVDGARYAGRDAPKEANPLANDAATAGDKRPAGRIKAPDGTTIVSTDPPILEVPGHGRVDIHAVIGATDGHADSIGHLLRWRAND